MFFLSGEHIKILRSSHIWRRPLRSAVPKFLENPSSRNIFAVACNAGDDLVVDVDGEKLSRLKKGRIPQGVGPN